MATTAGIRNPPMRDEFATAEGFSLPQPEFLDILPA